MDIRFNNLNKTIVNCKKCPFSQICKQNKYYQKKTKY